MATKTRITKKEYYEMGGQANSNLFRKQLKNGAWSYWKVGATRRKNAGYRSARKTLKRIKKSGYPRASILATKIRKRFSAKTSYMRDKRRKRNPSSSLNLHSIIKWGIIAGVGYFLFTRFVKPNLSSALSGIVPDSQMSWNYVNPSRMLAAQIGNPMGQMIRNMPITMGRGVY